jgi:hypothetical protein
MYVIDLVKVVNLSTCWQTLPKEMKTSFNPVFIDVSRNEWMLGRWKVHPDPAYSESRTLITSVR